MFFAIHAKKTSFGWFPNQDTFHLTQSSSKSNVPFYRSCDTHLHSIDFTCFNSLAPRASSSQGETKESLEIGVVVWSTWSISGSTRSTKTIKPLLHSSISLNICADLSLGFNQSRLSKLYRLRDENKHPHCRKQTFQTNPFSSQLCWGREGPCLFDFVDWLTLSWSICVRTITPTFEVISYEFSMQEKNDRRSPEVGELCYFNVPKACHNVQHESDHDSHL